MQWASINPELMPPSFTKNPGKPLNAKKLIKQTINKIYELQHCLGCAVIYINVIVTVKNYSKKYIHRALGNSV